MVFLGRDWQEYSIAALATEQNPPAATAVFVPLVLFLVMVLVQIENHQNIVAIAGPLHWLV